MHRFRFKQAHLCCLLALSLIAMPALAEGIIDIKPFISTSINYDDNVFRFSSPEQAKASLGSSDTSDVIKQLALGVVVNLRLSRQMITLSSSINNNSFNRFKNLDNTGKANSMRWSWRIGSDVYGELSAGETEAIAGFNENKSPVKNTTTTSRQLASINWNFMPDWTINASREHVNYENALASFNILDREDDVYETGLRYQSQLDTQLGIAYRIADSSFPNRVGFTQITLGNESTEKDIIVSAGWQPTAKTRLSARLSQVSLQRQGAAIGDFNGFSQRWSLEHKPTEKLNFNISAYQDVAPVDDVVSTYVKTRGISINPSWNITSKVLMRAGLAYEQRSYIGSAGVSLNNTDRSDESTQANLALIYVPTLKSLLQLQYQGEQRTSNLANADYSYNNLNLSFRYDY
jgi:exopolysaccharide biosynthesis operon protein EpsL